MNVTRLHEWLRVRLKTPDKCSRCNGKTTVELCNVSMEYNPDTYNTDLKNWFWACRKCHMEYDGRLKGLIKCSGESRLGKHITDKELRQCAECNSYETGMYQPKWAGHKTPYPHWNHLPWDKVNWYCNICYSKLIYKMKKKNKMVASTTTH